MFLDSSGHGSLQSNVRHRTAELLRIFLVDAAQTRSDRVVLASQGSYDSVTFDLPSFTGTVKVRGENRLELTYMVANLQQYAETEVFESLEATQHFLSRMIKVIRHYALPVLDRYQN
jgi:hypothetical protein